jgi:hypothetical protein
LDAHDPTVTQGIKNKLADVENQWRGFKDTYERVIKAAIATYNLHYQEARVPAVLIN